MVRRYPEPGLQRRRPPVARAVRCPGHAHRRAELTAADAGDRGTLGGQRPWTSQQRDFDRELQPAFLRLVEMGGVLAASVGGAAALGGSTGQEMGTARRRSGAAAVMMWVERV